MREIAVCDCETDPFRKGRVPKPFLWGFYNGSGYWQFERTDKFIEFLQEQDCICYAHNGGKFDFHYLLDALEPCDDIKIINGRIAQIHIGICELRDSFLIINEKLEKYKKTKIDYAIFEEKERHKKKNWDLITSYLKDDCVNLWEMVCEFIRRFGLELTQAGAAMSEWRKICPVDEDETDSEFYETFRGYYYGGRVECFRSGVIDTRFSVFDINSAYPYAMLHKHPYSSTFVHRSGYVENADFVHLRGVARGCFPCRGGEASGIGSFGLVFPDDDSNREYFVTGWEYETAKELGAIEDCEIIESYRFSRHIDFAEYIDKFWKLREEAKAKNDNLGSILNKLMMNSLYGKFAANPDNYRNYVIVDPGDWGDFETTAGMSHDPAKRWQFAGELGPWFLAERPLLDVQKKFYNVATGASITGFVRAMLFRAIHSSKGVLYCDTDSIACEQSGSDIIIGARLGQWKHEGNFDRAGIAGKKLYIFRGVRDDSGNREYKIASKGVRLTNSELWRVARGGEVEYTSEVPTYSPIKEPSFVTRKVRSTVRG